MYPLQKRKCAASCIYYYIEGNTMSGGLHWTLEQHIPHFKKTASFHSLGETKGCFISVGTGNRKGFGIK